MTKLKICPFCGEIPDKVIYANWQDKFVIECGYCGAEKRSEYSHDDAAGKWNERHFDNEDSR